MIFLGSSVFAGQKDIQGVDEIERIVLAFLEPASSATSVLQKSQKGEGSKNMEKGSFYIQSNFFKVESKKLYILTLWYKADGFGTEKPEYHGASASSDIIFFTEEKKEIPRLNFVSIGAGYPWSLPFPYCNINPWQIGTLIVKAPEKASYAVYRIGLSSTNKEVLPSIWIDNIWIREYRKNHW